MNQQEKKRFFESDHHRRHQRPPHRNSGVFNKKIKAVEKDIGDSIKSYKHLLINHINNYIFIRSETFGKLKKGLPAIRSNAAAALQMPSLQAA